MASNLSDPTRWTLRDLDEGRDSTLLNLVERTVAHISVEFLFVNGVKPHVVFNLAANPTVQDPDPLYAGVRLSMEWFGYDDLESGIFFIMPLEYLESSRSAHGAFDFPLLKRNLTIKSWCQILRGTYRGLPTPHTSDLTRFRFVVVPSTGNMDGCRDFICQSFMRLYDLKLVQGHGDGLGVGSSFVNFSLIPRHPELGTGDHYWFFDIIDKNFVKLNPGTENEKIRISPMPMHRGIFKPGSGPNVTRREVFVANGRSYPLNYVAIGQPQPPPGNGPGGPSGPGGGGNGGMGGNSSQRRPGLPSQPPAGRSTAEAGRRGVDAAGSRGGASGQQSTSQHSVITSKMAGLNLKKKVTHTEAPASAKGTPPTKVLLVKPQAKKSNPTRV